ncbi:FkbM family methyltransferase [Thermostichus vulcanus]|uniref:FkbM family methyltransferase n=1 Tax=Thermostichus vulcanus str. 'Rupite' TaxID=2813851 RepID=A0ABT0CE03_THEVL|nr:FkbM family methyltransferase [Thermostichus vulcanus]MCJ2544009.1 FkbM family methyltransferase [Thermostichus vulcanus str. 'Rupite']
MRFIRPEYIFRPSQIVRRLAYTIRNKHQPTQANTPWGTSIHFDPSELHGRAMLTLGLPDLRTCEMISRIVRKGDICIDIGANIGIMTSLMATRAGSSGTVYAFEPHPKTRLVLELNASSWKNKATMAEINVLPYAVSNRNGKAILFEPSNFSQNWGIATLEFEHKKSGDKQEGIEVDCITFDSFFNDASDIKLVKIDVEGHEDFVLTGMKEKLTKSLIKYILFEEHRTLPSPACDYLEKFGYKSYLIDRSLLAPKLIDVKMCPKKIYKETTNILAVLRKDSDIDIANLTQPGWSCLSVSGAI